MRTSSNRATLRKLAHGRLIRIVCGNKTLNKFCLFAFADASGNSHRYCFLCYRIPPDFVPTVVSHGNSKSSQPFFPTLPSTMERIRSESRMKGPKQTVANVSAAVGGLIKAECPGMLPRNEKQVANMRRQSARTSGSITANPSDELFVVMQQAKLGDHVGLFVRDLKAAPEPAIVVARDYQLQDLVRFATVEHKFSIVTVDPTFCLGEFDMTPITYRHLLLQSCRTHRPPVFVGPMLVHYRKTFSTYVFFASSLIGLKRELQGVRAFGTDGEEELVKALSHEFSFGLHLSCFIHMKRNIKHELSERGLSASSIMKDIFGRQVDSVREDGLVDSSSGEEFREKLEACESSWEAAEKECPGCRQGFYNWFVKYKSDILQESMLRNVREEAGLGNPPEEFTTNACESINAVLKGKVDYKKSNLPQFLDKMKELIDEQVKEVERAVVKRGKYEFQLEYKHLEIPEAKWFRMSSEQRNRHLDKVASTRVVAAFANSQSVPCGTSASNDDAATYTDALSVQVGDLPSGLSVPFASLEVFGKKLLS